VRRAALPRRRAMDFPAGIGHGAAVPKE